MDRPRQAAHRYCASRSPPGRPRAIGADGTGVGDPRMLLAHRLRRHPLRSGTGRGTRNGALTQAPAATPSTRSGLQRRLDRACTAVATSSLASAFGYPATSRRRPRRSPKPARRTYAGSDRGEGGVRPTTPGAPPTPGDGKHPPMMMPSSCWGASRRICIGPDVASTPGREPGTRVVPPCVVT